MKPAHEAHPGESWFALSVRCVSKLIGVIEPPTIERRSLRRWEARAAPHGSRGAACDLYTFTPMRAWPPGCRTSQTCLLRPCSEQVWLLWVGTLRTCQLHCGTEPRWTARLPQLVRRLKSQGETWSSLHSPLMCLLEQATCRLDRTPFVVH